MIGGTAPLLTWKNYFLSAILFAIIAESATYHSSVLETVLPAVKILTPYCKSTSCVLVMSATMPGELSDRKNSLHRLAKPNLDIQVSLVSYLIANIFLAKGPMAI